LRFKIGNGLIPLNLLTWALIAIILFLPHHILRFVLGIPFLLFIPGYSLTTAFFTKKEGISGIERVVLSFGLSIAIVPLMVLILNYTPSGIRLEPILYLVASFILITSIIAWLRQRRLAELERFTIQFRMAIPSLGKGIWDKVLSIMLVIIFLGALVTIGYVIATPKVAETFTEFYLLGPEGEAANYPEELMVGGEGRVTVGIINHEGREVRYRVEIVIGNKKSVEVGPIALSDEQKWEGDVSIVPEVAGENRKVEFLLYIDGEVKPFLEPLYLSVDVSE